MSVSQVYEVPDDQAWQCRVTGRLRLPEATVEIHQYRFRGPQSGVFRSARSFVDLALSRRPGRPCGTFSDRAGRRPLGDLLFIPAGHALDTEWGGGEQTSVCCAFDAATDVGVAASALEAALDVRSVPVREALLRLAREIEQPGWCSELLAQALCAQLSVELGRYMGSRLGSAIEAGLTPAQMRRIDELIEQPGKLPDVAEMARLCGISTRHFFRMFRAASGTTLVGYAAARRLARARQMLAMSRPPVKEIAWRCGFETPAAFSAAFRKATGVTPRQFRQSLLH